MSMVVEMMTVALVDLDSPMPLMGGRGRTSSKHEHLIPHPHSTCQRLLFIFSSTASNHNNEASVVFARQREGRERENVELEFLLLFFSEWN